jgi:Spy/CpxP family protein refolding chaperone
LRIRDQNEGEIAMRPRALLNSVKACSNVAAMLGVFGLLLLDGSAAFGQAPAADSHTQPGMADAAVQKRQLADQITELRTQVARLQAAVQRTGPGKKVNLRSGMKMGVASNNSTGMIDDKSETGTQGKSAMASGSGTTGMKDDQGEMGAMPIGGKSNTSLEPAPAMGMCCMGKMASGGDANKSAAPSGAAGMAAMSGRSSAMPGQAGSSHLYHIGSNGFFLNHSQHIILTPDQTLTLNHVKEKALLSQAAEQRRIDQAEQDLYTLTGADQPDNARFEAKIAQIEKLRAGQRMDFIRAVEDAGNVLTPEQRKALVGTMAANRK